MTGMSLLLPSARNCLRLALVNSKVVPKHLQKQATLFGQVCVRNAGGDSRKMPIHPSKFDWTRFKDDMHFYVFLGLVPAVAIVLYANVFIGPATLSDIEEGYEPKEWEYYKSPITRWFVKYFYQTPQKEYEMTLHGMHLRREEHYWNQLAKKCKALMSDRQDYKGWYWIDQKQPVPEYKPLSEGGTS